MCPGNLGTIALSNEQFSAWLFKQHFQDSLRALKSEYFYAFIPKNHRETFQIQEKMDYFDGIS